MSNAQTVPAKYIFLDIVGFTKGRSVEAQSDIVAKINMVVKEALDKLAIDDDKLILIPTGDGICIALLNVEDPYDVHMQIALSILSSVSGHNAITADSMRRFEVRIGVDANVDNLVTDINGRQNVAGAGINMASRIMSVADGGQVLVSQSVHNTLSQRESYMNLFNSFSATVKHRTPLTVFQLVASGHPGLNTDTPGEFILPPETEEEPEPKLTTAIAYYIAYAIQNRLIIIEKSKGPGYTKSSVLLGASILLRLLAHDAAERVGKQEHETSVVFTHNTPNNSFSERLDHYSSLGVGITYQFITMLGDGEFSAFQDCFENLRDKMCFITQKGVEKLQEDWPAVWKYCELEYKIRSG